LITIFFPIPENEKNTRDTKEIIKEITETMKVELDYIFYENLR